MPDVPDVLVVGAGPAGAVAATILARAGVRVRLLDRAWFPRDKLCGDTLNPGSLALLGRLGLSGAADRDGLPIDGMLVTGRGGAVVRARYPAGLQGRALQRRALDAALLSAAVAAGATFDDGVRVEGPRMTDGRVRGAILQGRGGRRVTIDAPLTIAADGRRSRFAFGLGLARHPLRPRRWAIGGYFAGVDGLTSFGEMHIREGSYLGVAALPGGLANACLVVESPRGIANPAARLAGALARDAATANRFADARLAGPVTTMGPLAVDVRAAGAPGLLLAGDAAGFIDPMTGDGLRFAIAGAMLAARAALLHLEGRLADPAAALDAWRRRAFEGKWRFNRAVRLLVATPPAVRLASTGARLAPGLIRRAVAYAGDVGVM
jgi:flavin-dependent dehydrogenase